MPRQLPYFYTRDQEQALMKQLQSHREHHMIADLLFGTGMRVSELVGNMPRRCIFCRSYHKPKWRKRSEPRPPPAICQQTRNVTQRNAKCDAWQPRYVGVSVEDIDWSQGTIRVLGKGSKERLVVMDQARLDRLKKYIRDRRIRSGKIFDITPRQVQRFFKKAAAEAGLPLDRNGRWSPHKARHTLLTRMIEEGGEDALVAAKEQAGHQSLQTTIQYLHVSTGYRRRMLERVAQNQP